MPRLESLNLPPISPQDSPPPSPATTVRGPRSVSWSIPSRSARPSISLPIIRIDKAESNRDELPREDPNDPDMLDWRRLHLSKAKLSGITEMAAVMAGFSVVATVELQINDDAHPVLLTAFTVTTALLVCTTMMAIMISTCILPHIQVIAEMSPNSKANESPHDLMMWYIDLSWVLANTVSIFLFTLDVIILCWIKFTYFSETASWCATIILSFVLFGVTFFGIVFYRRIVKQQYVLSDRKYQELEDMRRQLEISATILNV
ncbi:unnamed protein product [Orchesella dallaii]|uniref:Calcium release-activated calcium channel protein 1 n=1 Tax=Orchesella dallaii TaxID=48710 RepID=A0ABP1PSH7_9HEXA